MGDEMKILPGGCHLSAVASSRTTRAKAERPPRNKAASDQVSLSRLYTAIRSNEAALRLQSLELQVSRHSYWLPALDISRTLINENLIAA
jgi:hypothetical protein